MTQQEFDSILQRYLNDDATAEEKRLVEDWFDHIDQPQDGIDETQKDLIRKRIWAGVEKHSDIKTSQESWYFGLGRVAAAVAFLVLSFLFIKDRIPFNDAVKTGDKISSLEEISNSSRMVQRISLVDGTFVHLSPGGVLRFPKTFSDKREVHLEGEAFFEVRKDSLRPFLVYTREITTRVLGTSFRVYADNKANEIIVAVKTGKVSVLPSDTSFMSRESSPMVLIPNQQAIYNKQARTMHKTLIDEPKVITGEVALETHYENAPIAKILDAMEKDYGVTIDYSEESLDGCTLTSDMSEEGFYNRIEIICNAIGAQYEIQGTAVIITAKGCR